MRALSKNPDLKWLIETYFSNPQKNLKLLKGEKLIEQHQFNDRLYLVKKGSFAAYITTAENQQLKLFTATQNMFLGVISFFSRTFSSSATVIAEEDSIVAYIDQHEEVRVDKSGCCLFEQFMPVMVLELAQRHQREQQNAVDKEKALKKLIQSEKMVSLGQMAAGIAHELNNAIAVLDRNTEWLCDRLNQVWQEKYTREFEYFQLGLTRGRNVSTREVRKRTQKLIQHFQIAEANARIIAETGIELEKLTFSVADLNQLAEKLHHFWEIGAVFHDMKIAAKHATHVVRSVKDLAAPVSTGKSAVNLNESIQEALSLLGSPLRKIAVQLSLASLPPIVANQGALVQVWTNIITNAIESLNNAQTENPQLVITSFISKNIIAVRIQDNGPGIPKNDLSKIFQPDYTTKEKGLNFGPGLGLTIVSRIVENHNGLIFVTSKPGKTTFTIKLPLRDDYGKIDHTLR